MQSKNLSLCYSSRWDSNELNSSPGVVRPFLTILFLQVQIVSGHLKSCKFRKASQKTYQKENDPCATTGPGIVRRTHSSMNLRKENPHLLVLLLLPTYICSRYVVAGSYTYDHRTRQPMMTAAGPNEGGNAKKRRNQPKIDRRPTMYLRRKPTEKTTKPLKRRRSVVEKKRIIPKIGAPLFCFHRTGDEAGV